jgi:hypothetical protein
MKTREQILESIVENAFSIHTNLSDTFHYACADTEDIPGDDYLELIPLIEKYDYYAEVAYCAIKRGYDPQVKSVLTDKYYRAKQEILDMIYAGDKYSPFYGLMEYIDYPKDKPDWKKKFLEYFKVKEKCPYSSLKDAFDKLDIKVGDIIGDDKSGYKVKVTAIGQKNALVETVEIQGKPSNGWGEQVLDLYRFLNWLKKE